MASRRSSSRKTKVKKQKVISQKNEGFKSLEVKKHVPPALVLFSILALLAIFAYFKYQGTEKSNNLSNRDKGQVEATLESKLKEIYEKRAETDLGDDFSPRFSVFEDYQLGFRIAYPVGFNATSINNGVLVSSETGGGSITVLVGNGSFEVKTNKAGINEKQAEIIESSSVFMRDSFQFIDPQNSQDLKDRFSEGPGKDRY